MWNTLIIEPMTNTLLVIYNILFNNFGLAIIAFTILIRLITHPLTAQQMKSAAKMQSMQKSAKWTDMQKKYKDDKEKLAQEQMKLYKEMGVNPLGSCLPMLIQLPIIFGLYQSITRALAVTPLALVDFSTLTYPFVNAAALVPLNSQFLWMDLSQPERIYLFGIGIPVLTILVVITTYVQSKVMAPATSGPGDQGAQMSKMMNLYMPFFMGYIAYTLPAGLALYFVVSNVVGILQYAAMGKVNLASLLPLRKVKSSPRS